MNNTLAISPARTLLPIPISTTTPSPAIAARSSAVPILVTLGILFVLAVAAFLGVRRMRNWTPSGEVDLEANASADLEVDEKVVVDSPSPRHPAGAPSRSAAAPRANATSPANPTSTTIPLFTRSPPASPPRRSSPRKPKHGRGRGQPIDYSLHTPDAANSVDPALRPFSLLAKVRHIDAGPGAQRVLAKDLAERHWAYVMVRGPYVQTQEF